MNNPRLAGRYAKSLIDLATEQNQLDVVCNDMRLLNGISKTNPDFVALLRSPVIKPGTKGKILEAIIKDKISPMTSGFIKLLVTKGRELNLPEIVVAFIEQFNKIKGIHQVKITTAVPISDAVRDAIVAKVTASDAGIKGVEVETVVDDALIGGFLLETEGKLVDASVLKDLKDVQKQFLNNDYIHKLR